MKDNPRVPFDLPKNVTSIRPDRLHIEPIDPADHVDSLEKLLEAWGETPDTLIALLEGIAQVRSCGVPLETDIEARVVALEERIRKHSLKAKSDSTM
jgi:hypothetical protein